MLESVSIISIHYNAANLIINGIKSTLAFSGIPSSQIEFIIIDNSSNFPEKELSKLNINYKLINPKYNSGFARATNMGIKNASHDFILMMNQDAAFIEENSLAILIEKLKQLPKKTILGCKLTDEQGNFQESVWIDDPGIKREWRFSPFNQKLNPNWKSDFEAKKQEAHKQEGYVHRINGAFLLLNKSEAKNVEEILFDEDFFLYGEDVEWALRLKKKNWKFYHYPKVTIKHLGSASSKNENIKQQQIISSDWLVNRKFHGKLYLIALLSFIIINKFLDLLFLKFGKWRKQISQGIEKETKQRVNNYFTCLKKYGIKIIFKRKYSDNKNFLINHYENI